MKELLIAAALAAVLPFASATAQDYPSRPVTMIVPFPAGGPADSLARLLGDRMKVSLGQPVVVENRPGGDALVAASDAAWQALEPETRRRLERFGTIVTAPIPTIERLGGGSVRCMIAEVFLPRSTGRRNRSTASAASAAS